MKSICRYSKGPIGVGWDTWDIFIPFATLWVLQMTHLLQKCSANVVNPFVNHNYFHLCNHSPFRYMVFPMYRIMREEVSR